MSFETARVGAGSGEVLGRTLFSRLPVSGFGRGSFMACVPVGCRGEAWLKKGLRGLHAVSNDDIRPERPTGDLRLVGSPPPQPEHDLCPVSPLGVCSHFARFDKISVLSQIAL
jgi:hypothetical protein